jgi:hypothetical protein
MSPFDSVVFHFDDFNYGRRSQPYFFLTIQTQLVFFIPYNKMKKCISHWILNETFLISYVKKNKLFHSPKTCLSQGKTIAPFRLIYTLSATVDRPLTNGRAKISHHLKLILLYFILTILITEDDHNHIFFKQLQLSCFFFITYNKMNKYIAHCRNSSSIQ